MSEEKQHLSIVVTGAVDAGKSTTVRRLMNQLGGGITDDRKTVNIQASAEEERERGVVNSQSTRGEFFTEKYHYTIVDVPGHKDYIKNMIKGSATADVGLLLVPASYGDFEAAIAKEDPGAGIKEGQTRQHAKLLYVLGLQQIVVGVNKLDSCNWSEKRFQEIKNELVKLLKFVCFKPKKVPIIPYSSLSGENLLEKTDKAPWYKGWEANISPKETVSGYTLYDALNGFLKPNMRRPDAPFRLSLSNIYNIKGHGRIYAGTVAQGTLYPGDVVQIVPANLEGKVFCIEQHKKKLYSAKPGDSIGMSIVGISSSHKVIPGDVVYLKKEGEIYPVKTFTAIVAVQEHPRELKVGYTPVIFSRTAKVACKMTKIVWKQSKKTGGAKVEKPLGLSQFENAEVEFEPTQSLFLEPFDQVPALGRIAVMDGNCLKMLGKVTGVVGTTEPVRNIDNVKGPHMIDMGDGGVFYSYGC